MKVNTALLAITVVVSVIFGPVAVARQPAGLTTFDRSGLSRIGLDVRTGPINDRVIELTEPLLRPASKPCIVTLFKKREFRGSKPFPIAYRPASKCPGPWSLVVLEAGFDVTAGAQFDRTASITLAGATLFLGTTMEPGSGYAPHWTVERDVTDYSALFRQPASGSADLENYTDAEHDGRLSWAARLVFYPRQSSGTSFQFVRPVTEGLQRLDAGTLVASRDLRLPRNLTDIVLDVFVIGQAREEFWFDCKPVGHSQLAMPWKTPCAAPFREVEVRIDGILAGVRTVTPVIFTGGIGPALWRRTPGLHATNLPSARIDLTPFAGQLNDGRRHKITLSMPMAKDHFRIGAVLLGRVDPNLPIVPGAVVANTLAPVRFRNDTISTAPGKDRRTIDTTHATRSDRIMGYVVTSRGRITTRIDYELDSRLTNAVTSTRATQQIDIRQGTITTTTPTSGSPSIGRLDERDRLVVDIHVAPPLYGVTHGTEVAQTSERIITNNGGQQQVVKTLKTFAPTSSPFSNFRETPNRVTATYRISDTTGCRQAKVDVADNDVVQFAQMPCGNQRKTP